MPDDVTSTDAATPPRRSTKGRCGPVQTVSNNTSTLTEGDLARARTAKILARLLSWWRSPIDTPIHTHCSGCGARLSRPTLGPSRCHNCNAPKPFENLEGM
jgi:hypothetical protein